MATGDDELDGPAAGASDAPDAAGAPPPPPDPTGATPLSRADRRRRRAAELASGVPLDPRAIEARAAADHAAAVAAAHGGEGAPSTPTPTPTAPDEPAPSRAAASAADVPPPDPSSTVPPSATSETPVAAAPVEPAPVEPAPTEPAVGATDDTLLSRADRRRRRAAEIASGVPLDPRAIEARAAADHAAAVAAAHGSGQPPTSTPPVEAAPTRAAASAADVPRPDPIAAAAPPVAPAPPPDAAAIEPTPGGTGDVVLSRADRRRRRAAELASGVPLDPRVIEARARADHDAARAAAGRPPLGAEEPAAEVVPPQPARTPPPPDLVATVTPTPLDPDGPTRAAASAADVPRPEPTAAPVTAVAPAPVAPVPVTPAPSPSTPATAAVLSRADRRRRRAAELASGVALDPRGIEARARADHAAARAAAGLPAFGAEDDRPPSDAPAATAPLAAPAPAATPIPPTPPAAVPATATPVTPTPVPAAAAPVAMPVAPAPAAGPGPAQPRLSRADRRRRRAAELASGVSLDPRGIEARARADHEAARAAAGLPPLAVPEPKGETPAPPAAAVPTAATTAPVVEPAPAAAAAPAPISPPPSTTPPAAVTSDAPTDAPVLSRAERRRRRADEEAAGVVIDPRELQARRARERAAAASDQPEDAVAPAPVPAAEDWHHRTATPADTGGIDLAPEPAQQRAHSNVAEARADAHVLPVTSHPGGSDGTLPAAGVADPPAAAARASAPLVPDLVEVSVPRGGRVIVVSDLHLWSKVSQAATECTAEMIRLLPTLDGAAVFVIAGDCFELLVPPAATVDGILDVHQEWTDAVKAFADGPDHQLVVLAGNHDGQIAWDPEVVATLRRRMGADQVSLAVDLLLETARGVEKVRVVHGNQTDPYNRFVNPRDPNDTPFGHHIVRELLPEMQPVERPGALLEGLPWLAEPLQSSEMVGSRLLYRLVAGRLWWLTIPFLAAVFLRLMTFLPGVERLLHDNAERWLIGLGAILVIVAVVAVVVAVATMLRVHHTLSETDIGHRSGPGGHNAHARELAGVLIGEGYAGLVTGHTHSPELSVAGVGFYANSGCGVEVVEARPSRLGLPRPFGSVRRCSRVEVDAHEVLEVRLVLADAPVASPVLLERLATRSPKNVPTTPKVVAALPGASTYPIDATRLGVWTRRRRVRQWAAGGLVAAGVVNVVSAIIGPGGGRLRELERAVPLRFPRVASVLAVLIGLALIGLARSVRRGYRPAWAAVVALLGITSCVMLLKGIDIEEAVLGTALALWLLANHRHFKVMPPGRRRWEVWATTVALMAVALAIALSSVFGRQERLPRVLVALVVGVVALVAWAATRPARYKRSVQSNHAENLERGRAIVEKYGGDTLDYFALRDDKELLFSGGGLVAYTVLDRVMLVSPDPICPAEERIDVWADAMDHADSHGWGIAVLAANASWLPVYHAAGLQDFYIGDEAIAECQRFSLNGKEMKSLRGAYNRAAKAGYTVKMSDPAEVEPALKEQLLELMTETRQGDAERGFSMTLSRMFDPRDTGLLLAVCFDPENKPVAFNQYIPAPAIGGFSLDVMRRTNDPDAPNGLTDYVIIETMNWMRDRGYRGLGLNFATFRAVMAGEETGPWRDVERKVLHRFSDTMQIESLWKFNQKYDPIWRPRYVVTDALFNGARAGMAIGRAEGEVEIPVIGRFLKSDGPDPAAELEKAHR